MLTGLGGHIELKCKCDKKDQRCCVSLSLKAGLMGRSDSERNVVSLCAKLGHSCRLSEGKFVVSRGRLCRDVPSAGLIGRTERRSDCVGCGFSDCRASMVESFSAG